MKTLNHNWAVRFIPLWVGQALSLLGSQLVQFAIIWYLTQKTNSATTLAIASMMGLLPQMHRDEVVIGKTVRLLLKAAYGIDYEGRNIPCAYLAG